MWTVLNADTLRGAALVTAPFPHLIIDNRGSFPPEAVSCSGRFATLIEEMHSVELRDLVGERLGMDLKDKPPMLTVRGRTGKKDGRIHTDSKSKLVTVLL